MEGMAADVAAVGAATGAAAAAAAERGVEPSDMELGDECGGEDGEGDEGRCALSALQLQGRRTSIAHEALFQGEGLEAEAADLQGSGSDDVEVLSQAAATADGGDSEELNLCGGTAYDISHEGCCGGKAVYSYSTQGCCGGSAVYSFAKEGCCNKEAVFSLSKPGGCVSSAPTPGGASGSAGAPAPASSFKCKAQWPIPRARAGWSYYCSMKPPKVWAMNADCTYAWYSVQQKSKDVAEKTALETCENGGKTNCTIFDLDGNICGEHAQTRYCNGVAYDISSQGCCGGRVYPYGTYDCCGGTHIFRRSTQGCCAGTVFDSHRYGCCGGRKLFVASTHGCCLNDGLQIYEMGTQNCCAQPKGVCTIPEGYYSCCR